MSAASSPPIALIAPDFNGERWADRLRRSGAAEVAIWPDINPAGVRFAAVWMPPASYLKGFPDLEVIFNLGAGVDHLLADPDLPDVPVVRSVDPDLTARMSDHIVLHALLHTRRIPEYASLQRARSWKALRAPVTSEVTVGIMGLGVLGRDATEKLRAVGFSVAGWSRTPRSLPGITCFSGQDGLGPFLAATDILVCLLPATGETRGLIDAGLIARLRRDGALGGPILINAARGACHVEADVISALGDGTLVAASLDVFETEPLPEESPLWAMENVVITPHIAAVSDPDALAARVMASIAAYEAGGPDALTHVVDRRRGY